MVSPPAGHQQNTRDSLIVNTKQLFLFLDVSLGGGSQLRLLCCLPVSLCKPFLSSQKGHKTNHCCPFLGGPTCSHFKLSQRATAYSNIQQNYETKGPGPLSAAPVSRITSQTHSPATKASIVRQPSPRISSGGDCTLNWA